MSRLFRRGQLGVALAAIAIASLAGCASLTPYSAPVKPPLALLFIDCKAPLTVEFNGTPVGPALKKVSKKQTTFFRDILFTGGTLAWDDAAIAQIAREGGIEQVAYADYEMMNLLGIYGTFTINVYGN